MILCSLTCIFLIGLTKKQEVEDSAKNNNAWYGVCCVLNWSGLNSMEHAQPSSGSIIHGTTVKREGGNMNKRTNKISVLAAFLTFLAVQTVWAADCYVSKAGNDGNSGTEVSPWLTIQRAANSAIAGSTVNIKAGTYKEKVNINVSGSAAEGFITFQNYGTDIVILDGAGLSVSGSAALLNIESKAYIRIKGLQICNLKTSTKGAVPMGVFIAGTAGNIEIRNNYIHHIANTAAIAAGGNGRNANGLAVYGNSGTAPISNLIIDGNEIAFCTLGSSESLVVNGNVDTFQITNNVIHDNDNIGIDCAGFYGAAPANDQARNGLIQGNTVYNITSYGNPAYGTNIRAADGIYVDGGRDIIIERNVVHHVDIGIEVASEHSGKTTTGVTVRSNLIYRCYYTGLAFGGYTTSVGWTANCVFENNTLVQNNTTNTLTGDIMIQQSHDNVVKNNIVYTSSQNVPVTNPFGNASSYDNTLDYNLYFTPGGDSNSSWKWNNNDYKGFEAYKTASGQDSNSVFSNPLFKSLALFDVYLQDGSPAVNHGDPAYVSGAGEKDLFGNDRLSGASVDIGAFENNGQITADVATLRVNEGSEAVFRVRLTNQPAASRTVTVARSSGDSDITVSSGASLVFNSINWDTYQDVTLFAAEDPDTVNGTAIISCTSPGITTKNVTVTEVDDEFTLTFNNDGNGTTIPAGAEIVDKHDSPYSISATANANYHFSNWSVLSGPAVFADATAASTSVTASENVTARANFARNTATLTVNKNGNGSAGFSLVNPVNTATAIPITANAYANNRFVNWTLDSGSVPAIIANAKSATTTVTLTGGHGSSVTITANFAKDTTTPTAVPAAPEVSATDGTCEDRVVITWPAVATATRYEVYRNNINSTAGITDPIGETADCIFEDNTAEYGTTYFYFAKAKNLYYNSATKSVESGISKFSVGNSGYITKVPVSPASVTVSNGTCFDKILVTWPKVAAATSYELYRSPTKTITGASIANPCVITAIAHGFNTGDAVLINGVGGTIGTLLNGKTFAITEIITDSTFSVTVDGSTTGKTYLPGGTAISAKHIVRKNQDAVFADVTIACDSRLTTYSYSDTADIDDPNPNPDSTYYYWVSAVNANGASPLKISADVGSIKKTGPTSVTASKGTCFDKVKITWLAVAGATGYDIYASETDAPITAANIGKVSGNTYEYYDIKLDSVKIYYWVKAIFNGYSSDFSTPSSSGYAKITVPITLIAPVLKSVSKGEGAFVKIVWGETPLAVSYNIYRKISATNTWAPLNDTAITGLSYTDTNASAGQTYMYCVRAVNGATDSPFSASMSGYAAWPLAAPVINDPANPTDTFFSPNLSGGVGNQKVYQITVPAGVSRLVAKAESVTGSCDLYAKLGMYPTTVGYNAKGTAITGTANKTLTVTNPAEGTWYVLLYGTGTAGYGYTNLSIDYYTSTDIIFTQVPINDLAVPFTATFKGRVLDRTGSGIAGLNLQVRNPITGIISRLPANTDAAGLFTYSALINTEGEHTFDFFFTEMPDNAKGTASHTVATRKGCLVEEPNNFFDFSRYIPATPVAVPLQSDVVGIQTFLDIRRGWNVTGTVSPGNIYETMWVNSTIVKAESDAQLPRDNGLYMYFYGVEGASVGNDTTANSALSAVPYVVHVESSKKTEVLNKLKSLSLIDDIEGGKIGIVAVASLSKPDEATKGCNISLIAREQLEILAKIAAGSGVSVDYPGVTAKKVTITLGTGREINVVASAFLK